MILSLYNHGHTPAPKKDTFIFKPKKKKEKSITEWADKIGGKRLLSEKRTLNLKLTAASTLAGDSSLGLDSMDIMLNTILSTWNSFFRSTSNTHV